MEICLANAFSWLLMAADSVAWLVRVSVTVRIAETLRLTSSATALCCSAALAICRFMSLITVTASLILPNACAA